MLTSFTGSVDEVDGQSVQTKFISLGLPLIPLQSFFVLDEKNNEVNGFPIAFNVKSVFFAYARWATFFVGALFTVEAIYNPEHRSAGEIALAVVFVVAWLALTFVLGGLSADERARRVVLKRVSGIAAPPELVPTDMAMTVLTELQSEPRPDDPDWVFVEASYRARVTQSNR